MQSSSSIESRKDNDRGRKSSARRVSLLSQRDIVRLNRSQKLLKEDPFARPMGSEVVHPHAAVVVGCFVSNPKKEDMEVPPNPLVANTEAFDCRAEKLTDKKEPKNGVSGEASEPQIFVRVQLGGQAEQTLPLPIMRKEHPQLLIDYLLSTAHLM